MAARLDVQLAWPAWFKAYWSSSKTSATSPAWITCTASSGSRPAGRTYDYFYFPPKSDADPMTIVACDIGGNHRDGSRNVLRAAGSVHRMSAGEFQAALADPANAAFAAALLQVETSAGRTLNRGD